MRAIPNRVRAEVIGTLCVGAMVMLSCSGGEQLGTTAGSSSACSPGARINCTCPDGRPSTQSCAQSGKGYGECTCAQTVAVVPPPPPMMTTPPPTTTTSVTPTMPNPAANGGVPGIPTTPQTPPATPQTPPPQTAPMVPVTMPGPGAAAGGMATVPAAGTAAPMPTGSDDMLRDACVAEINMYRAMRTDAPPLKRATAAQEMCSDQGAQSDGDTMSAHGFFKMSGTCIQKVGLSAQDSCPGYPVGGFGSATVVDALKQCLKQMWAEGEPPQGREACQQDSAGCFQKYGHWLNMSNPKASAVSCAFYKMKDGKSYWMNQDFVVSFR